MYVVWVGGIEVNDLMLQKIEAKWLARFYVEKGYDDVAIENTKTGEVSRVF